MMTVKSYKLLLVDGVGLIFCDNFFAESQMFFKGETFPSKKKKVPYLLFSNR